MSLHQYSENIFVLDQVWEAAGGSPYQNQKGYNVMAKLTNGPESRYGFDVVLEDVGDNIQPG